MVYNCYAQDLCSCSCCDTNFCTAIYQGTTQVGSCSASCNAACGSVYPICYPPANGGVGEIIATCAAISPTGGNSHTTGNAEVTAYQGNTCAASNLLGSTNTQGSNSCFDIVVQGTNLYFSLTCSNTNQADLTMWSSTSGCQGMSQTFVGTGDGKACIIFEPSTYGGSATVKCPSNSASILSTDVRVFIVLVVVVVMMLSL